MWLLHAQGLHFLKTHYKEIKFQTKILGGNETFVEEFLKYFETVHILNYFALQRVVCISLSDQINFLSACFWSPWKKVCLHCVLTSSLPLKMIPKSDKGIFCDVTVSYIRMKFILVNTKLIIFMIKLTITQYLFQHPIKANTVLA